MKTTLYTQSDKVDGIYDIDEKGLKYWKLGDYGGNLYKTIGGAKRALNTANKNDNGQITEAYILNHSDGYRVSYTYD